MLRVVPVFLLFACGPGDPPVDPDGPAPTGSTAPVPTGWSAFEPAFEGELRTGLDEIVAEMGVPGAALAVIDPTGQRIWVGTTGLADVDAAEPWTAQAPYPIGSVTKTMTAALVLQHVEEGTLTLDDPLDDWVDSPWSGQGITVRHLMQHTSGVASYNYVGSFDGSQPHTPEELLDWAYLHEPALQFTPGSEWTYSNSGYVLLGLVAEQAGGAPLADQFDARFFGPLGLTHTSLATAHPADLVHGYRSDPERDATDEFHPSSGWAAGGVISTPEDTARWGAALFSGQVVSQATLTEMTTPLELPSAEGNYGLGLFGSCDPEWGGNWGHTGGYSGQLSYVYYMERVDRVVVALVNSFDGDLDAVANVAWYPIWGLEP